MRSILLSTAFSMIAASAAAVPIYSEDFTGQDGKGAVGQNPSSTSVAVTDLAGVGWSLALGDARLFNTGDFARVVGGAFTFQDTNAGCSNNGCPDTGPISGLSLPMWLSPVLDISAFQNISVALDYLTSGSFENSGGIGEEDTFVLTTILDGVATDTNLLTTLGGGPGNALAPIGSGTSLQIKVTGNTYAASEVLSFDNVSVSGDMIAAVPLPATGLMLLAGLGLLGLRRRTG